jgi:ArsR family transcriptional regulator
MKKPADLVTLFQALADRTRLRLINLMARGEVCVCFFVEVLGENQPKISRHLAYLRNAGLVQARREGKWMHYRLLPQQGEAEKILGTTLAAIEHEPAMQQDRRALDRVCCTPPGTATLQNAPRPTFVKR